MYGKDKEKKTNHMIYDKEYELCKENFTYKNGQKTHTDTREHRNYLRK